MLTGDRHPAEDVLQDTMVRIHQHWRRVEQVADFDRYVRRMVTNQYPG
jgi:DNA-directed RNA polymerase specialized sigma24 family protein